MALEPAGVSLQAQNFNKYIKNLQAIEKQQKEVFEREFKKTGLSFQQVTKAARDYERQLTETAKAEKRAAVAAEKLAQNQVKAAEKARKAQIKAAEDVAKARKKAADEAKKIVAAERTARATQQQAFISAGSVVLDFAQKIGTVTIESGKLAAQFEGQRIGLNNLAASFGQSGTEIQSAIQSASKGTISGLQAINAANQGLLLGVAKTPAEFANLTDTALTLGRTLGLTGTQAIEQFTTALGRQSLLILDNFGISAKQVNVEIERLARADFGVARSQLTDAQKQATFMKAALNIAGEAAATIGEEAGKAQEAFERLGAVSEDLQVTFGTLARPLGTGIANALSRAAKIAQQFFAFLGAGFTGIGTIATGVFDNVVNTVKGGIEKTKQLFATGDLDILFEPVTEDVKSFSDILDEAGLAAIDRFKDIASTIEGVSFDEEIVDPIETQNDELEKATINLEAYQRAIQQAEQLQLSFARAAEDAALKLARANEDIARKQTKSVAKLQERQVKDRDKLLKNQVKQLDDFEKDRRKQIAKAESDIAKTRKEAADQQKRDQQKLQRELQQAQDRFNLSRLQSERRFSLQESRLRAEGDILGLKELREDFALQQQEEKENFDLSAKEQVSSAKEQQKEQSKDLESRVKELKSNLENRRAELLASFDEQLRNQQIAQEEARAEQQRGFEEAAAERAIQLAREEEDKRISQARQLEDLGRSLAEQEGVTAEGSAKIAAELEKVFGVEGTADNIMTGFTTKTENEFAELFENLEQTVIKADLKKLLQEKQAAALPGTLRRSPARTSGGGGFGSRIGGLSEFQEGGIVPGPIGSPQIIQAHGGEMVLPTHQQSFTMAAPVIPSQALNVNMSGGFNISGDGQANDTILQEATEEMTENFRIAVTRLARRN